jgi:4a-hydroxytetrahydrobiopterin dehydratase
MTTLPEDRIRAELATLPGWELVDGAIAKRYKLGGFPGAVAFVVRLSFAAEAADHHPDLDVRYDTVTVTLSTHSEGGVTAKDLDLARAIEALAPAR